MKQNPILFLSSLLGLLFFALVRTKNPKAPDSDQHRHRWYRSRRQPVDGSLSYVQRPFETEGLISSPSYGSGHKSEILRMIDLYEKDLPKLKKHSGDFPSPEYLRSISKQGRIGAAPYCGYSTATEGSDWIIRCARKKSEQPLWVLVWGGLDDVAQALHDAPDIQDKIRIYWIGGPNKKWSTNSYAYIVENFPTCGSSKNNSSYRGFIANYKQMDEFNGKYYDTNIRRGGKLGEDFINYQNGNTKMGDTPSLLYMMNGDPNDPTKESWGGSFVKISRSPQILFDRPTTAQDTAQIYSIMEFRVKGPELNIPPDSICMIMTINKQTWGGFYLGEGIYAVRHTTYALGTMPYTIVSDIPGFPEQKGEITVVNVWPGKNREQILNWEVIGIPIKATKRCLIITTMASKPYPNGA